MLFLLTSVALLSFSSHGTSHLSGQSPEKADLSVNIIKAPEEIVAGEDYRLTVRISNSGGNGAPGGTNADNSSFRALIRMVYLGTFPERVFDVRESRVHGLAGGKQLDWVFFWNNVPRLSPGRYRLEVLVDAGHEINETRESNNLASVILNLGQNAVSYPEDSCVAVGQGCLKNEDCCPGRGLYCSTSTCVVETPDLSVEIKESPGQFNVNGEYELLTVISNTGGSGGNVDDSPFEIMLRLVDRDRPSKVFPVRQVKVMGLGGGKKIDWRFFWNDLPRISEGRYRLEVHVDSGLQIDESNESNNVDFEFLTLSSSCYSLDESCSDDPDCCSDEDLTCVSGTCQKVCGELNQSCCSVGSECGVSLVCDDSSGSQICQSCGLEDQLCCSGNVCTVQGLTCNQSSGRCEAVSCGAVEQACCSSDPKCDSGLACAGSYGSQSCQSCGLETELCCSGNVCTVQGLACASSGRCEAVSCGGVYQACCSDDPKCIGSGLVCDDSSGSQICQSCGLEDQLCCSNDACSGQDLACSQSSGRCRAVSCGGVYQACCSYDPKCIGSGLVCDDSSGSQICQSCGLEDQLCCAGRVCTGQGLTCDTSSGLCEAVSCGGVYQACCSDDPKCIGSGLVCDDSSGSQICQSCGLEDQLCCSNDACSGQGLACSQSSGRCRAVSCGGVYQACCSYDPKCIGSGLVCDDSSGSQICQSCGLEDQLCCSNDACSGQDLACSQSSGRCRAVQCGFATQPCCSGNSPCEQGLECNPSSGECEVAQTPEADKPDLVVELINPPREFVLSENDSENRYTTTLRVTNQGDGDTLNNVLPGKNPAFNFGVIVESATSASPTPIDVITATISSLTAGDYFERQFTISLGSQVDAGRYNLLAFVDNQSNIDESNERNNIDQAEFSIILQSSYNVCDRTPQVRDGILAALSESDCSSVTLEQLEGIGTLDLNTKGISSLKPGDFNGLTGLEILNLHKNGLVSLPRGIFDDLTGLKWLRLGNNELISLPRGIFDQLTNLEGLSVYNNDLRSLPSNAFDDLTRLRWLFVSNNSLVSLPRGIFDQLTNIEWLYINNNDLRSLPANVFEDLTRLEVLDSSQNAFSCIPREAFGSRTDDFSSIWSSYNRSDRINICASAIDICSRTPQVRDEIVLQLGVSSCNQVTRAQVQSITRLSLTEKNIRNLKPGDFNDLTNLRNLYLSKNRLETLPSNIFDGLTLRYLYLRDNNIRDLPANIFASLSPVPGEGLYIAFPQNTLFCIPRDAFGSRSIQDIRVTLSKMTTPTTNALCRPGGRKTPDFTIDPARLPDPLVFDVNGPNFNLAMNIRDNAEIVVTIPYEVSLLKNGVQIDSKRNSGVISGTDTSNALVSIIFDFGVLDADGIRRQTNSGNVVFNASNLNPGEYTVVITANPDREITEPNYNNNEESYDIVLR